MVVENPLEITQEKLSPGEVKFLKQLTELKPAPYHTFQGAIEALSNALLQWLRPVGAERWPSGGKMIFRRIMNFALEHHVDDHGFVRLAMYAGQMPHLSLAGNNIPPTTGLVFDITDQIVHRGWMHGEDKFAGAELKIPLGVQIVCQHLAHPVYEDWVGMGAPTEVVAPTTLTDGQVGRMQLLANPTKPGPAPAPA